MAEATYTSAGPDAAGVETLTVGFGAGNVITVRLVGNEVYLTQPGVPERQIVDRRDARRLFRALKVALLTGVDPG